MTQAAANPLDVRLRQQVLAPLARLRQRCRLYLGLSGLRVVLLALLAAGVVQFALDRYLKLSLDQRVVLSAVIALFGLRLAARRLLRPLFQPLPDAFLAGLVDRANPGLHGQLASAVQLAEADGGLAARRYGEDRMSPELVRVALEGACDRAGQIAFSDVLNHRRARGCALALLGLLAVAACAAALLPEQTRTWFARNWMLQDVAWPQQTHIWPDGFGADGRRRMAHGDMVRITATVAGVMPSGATLTWHTLSGRHGNEAMSLLGDTQLAASVGQLTEDLYFHISGGDEKTREFVVESTERPRVLYTVARITPPEYTHLPPVVLEQQTYLEVLQGSQLEIDARLNKPVKSARLIGADGSEMPCDVVEAAASAPAEAVPGSEVRVKWAAPVPGVYRFELVDDDGLTSQNAIRYAIKIVPDLPPTVQMELAGVGEMVTPEAQLPVGVHCEDTYGLGAAYVIVQVGSKPEVPIAVAGLKPGTTSFATKLTLAVGATGAVPTDRLQIRAQASDLDPHGPNVGTTPVTTLRVVTPAELQAEMARRELVLRQEFERLRSGQRELKEALGRLLGALEPGATPSEAAAARLAGLARSQADQATRCLAIGRGFEQVLAEMQVNRIARAVDERRITDRLVVPLDHLARDTVPRSTGVITGLRRSVTDAAKQVCLATESDILRQMDEILANMLEWEGYGEAVALLHEIINAQTTLRTDTLHALEHQLDDILGPDEPPQSAPTGGEPPTP